MISRLKFLSSIVCWLFSFPIVLGITENSIVLNFSILFFLLVIIFSMLKMQLQNYFILFVLILISIVLINTLPTFGAILTSAKFSLIFACVFPTLIFARSVATEMESIKKSQYKLSQLKSENTSLGIQFTSHFLGGVINVGSFPMLAATLPKNASRKRRKLSSEAALRGMNSAVLWSPFFISFAVASAYFPEGFESRAILLGIFTAFFFNILTATIFVSKVSKSSFIDALEPIKPIILRLCVIIISVILVSYATGLNALYAVVATMPFLCVIQILRRRCLYRKIFQNFYELEKNSGDELVIISFSMMISVLATDSSFLSMHLGKIISYDIGMWKFIWIFPVFVWFCSIFGIHPVVSSAPLLGFISPSLTVFDSIFLMQSHMIGWASGTMTSFSSMSIITVANQFNLRPLELAFGKNLFVSGALAFLGGGYVAFLYVNL